jgi:hypothetical protein
MKMVNQHKHIWVSLGLASVLLMGAGCKKVLDINQNPSVPSADASTPAVVFPIGVLATTGYIGGDVEILGGMWSQYFTQSALAQQYTDVDSYNMPNTDGFVNGPWDNLFPTALENYQLVIQKAQANQDWTFNLLGTVMKCYTAEVMADLWDKMPYSQALNGQTMLNPQFDSGQTIYRLMIDSLESAKAKDFTATTNSTPSASQDPIFGSNSSTEIANWTAFANTLELKMYLRMVNANPTLAQQGVTNLLNSNAPFLTQDAAFTNFTDNPGLENPFYEQNIRELNTNSNLRASYTYVSWLQANNDSRITYWFGSTTPNSINQGDYHGGNPAYQTAAIFYQSPLDPVEYISLAESYFLQAEAAVRYNGGANAQSLYNAGVTAAFAEVGLDGSSYIAPGGAYEWGKEVEGGKTLTPIQQIMRQKWASFAYGCHAIEAWFDMNRTGFPIQSPVYSTDPSYVPGQVVVAKNSVLTAGDLPKRLVYPYDELSRNTNAPAVVPMTTPVWWAIQ